MVKMTSMRVRVEMDNRCSRIRSNVKRGQVGRLTMEMLSEQTPRESVKAQNAMVAAERHQVSCHLEGRGTLTCPEDPQHRYDGVFHPIEIHAPWSR